MRDAPTLATQIAEDFAEGDIEGVLVGGHWTAG